ncbi:unnamed protein product [Citrullus colocynthis]|uniref:Uncharacterized protein n=1 Tax=Citrullus colocynthis TaxID=252529 RepID=A0ABP0Z819_9ROSI
MHDDLTPKTYSIHCGMCSDQQPAISVKYEGSRSANELDQRLMTHSVSDHRLQETRQGFAKFIHNNKGVLGNGYF